MQSPISSSILVSLGDLGESRVVRLSLQQCKGLLCCNLGCVLCAYNKATVGVKELQVLQTPSALLMVFCLVSFSVYLG